MAEVLAEFAEVLVDQGISYHAHACGAQMSDGKWQGWLEFVPLNGGPPLRSPRETTQPNRTDAAYWATGLTGVYLEGALQRALHPLVVHQIESDQSQFDEPAPIAKGTVSPTSVPDAVLDPFAVHVNEGDLILRQELAALATWHLVNIIRHYELSDEPTAVLNRLPAAALIDRIVIAVRSGTRA